MDQEQTQTAPAVEQGCRVRLWEIEEKDLTPEQLVDILAERYAPSVVPSCRVCGGVLSIGAVGGGEPTRWYCEAMAGAPKNGQVMDWKHFGDSLWVDRRRGGDPYVMELARRFQQSNNQTLPPAAGGQE